MSRKNNPTYIPTYLQVEEQLICYFKENNLVGGDKLPTELELTELFKVSRTTIRKALDNLQYKGFLNRVSGKGTFYTGVPNQNDVFSGHKTIGLVNYFFMDYIYTEILRGIEDEADSFGFSLIKSNNIRRLENQNETIEEMIRQKVDGIILEPISGLNVGDMLPVLWKLKDAGIPVVSTHRPIHHSSVSMVTVDDVYAGEMAARYLLEKGHRKIGFVFYTDSRPVRNRFEGFSRVLREEGFPLDDAFCTRIDPSEDSSDSLRGYVLTKKMMKDSQYRPTAIFYFNDQLAIQGYKAAAELGLSIPEDLSILGFDDHKNAAVVSPPLTTFVHPKYDLGRWTAKILIDEIENGASCEPMQLLFEPELLERGSVASRILP